MRKPGRLRLVLFAALVLLCCAPLSLRSAEIPFLSGRVNDTAGLLSPEMARELEALLREHEDSTSNQVALLTITSLEGEQLEEYSIRVVDSWKLGQKKKDNGVLLLVVRDDRKVRIEVGRGLEGDLPDITCGTIVRKEIIPRFKEGDYNQGIHDGLVAILAAIHGSYAPDTENDDAGDWVGKVIAFLIFFVVVGIFTLIALFSKGGGSWFLYFFLYPFWAAFPMAIFGFLPGLVAFLTYAIGFLVLKAWFARSTAGKALFNRGFTMGGFAPSGGGRTSGIRWSSGGSSSSGSSFSGGGGGFSGGGSSGSW